MNWSNQFQLLHSIFVKFLAFGTRINTRVQKLLQILRVTFLASLAILDLM